MDPPADAGGTDLITRVREAIAKTRVVAIKSRKNKNATNSIESAALCSPLKLNSIVSSGHKRLAGC
jgi:hypothetical protein